MSSMPFARTLSRIRAYMILVVLLIGNLSMVLDSSILAKGVYQLS